MPIDYSKLRGLTARELIRALLQDGFELDRQKGAHQQYRHPEDRRRVTVSFHRPGDTFLVKTLKSMIEHQAKWAEDDLRRLRLLIKEEDLSGLVESIVGRTVAVTALQTAP